MQKDLEKYRITKGTQCSKETGSYLRFRSCSFEFDIVWTFRNKKILDSACEFDSLSFPTRRSVLSSIRF